MCHVGPNLRDCTQLLPHTPDVGSWSLGAAPHLRGEELFKSTHKEKNVVKLVDIF